MKVDRNDVVPIFRRHGDGERLPFPFDGDAVREGLIRPFLEVAGKDALVLQENFNACECGLLGQDDEGEKEREQKDEDDGV